MVTPLVGIVDIGIGNISSVYHAIDRCGSDCQIVTDVSQMDDVTHLILPGVGHFDEGMKRLSLHGFDHAILSFAESGRPLLGICLGMQILCNQSSEGCSDGLSLLPGNLSKISAPRVPHVGWNEVDFIVDHPLFDSIKTKKDYYFVHSYALRESMDCVLATTDYFQTIGAIVGRGNVAGFQFHPEKSQKNGLQLLENFCFWDGRC